MNSGFEALNYRLICKTPLQLQFLDSFLRGKNRFCMKQFFLSKRKVPGSQMVSAGSAPLRMSRLSLSSQQGRSEILGGENVSPSGLSINLCGRDLRCFQRPYHAPQKEAKSFHRRWNSQSNLECIVPGCCPNLQLEQVGFFKQADFQTIML